MEKIKGLIFKEKKSKEPSYVLTIKADSNDADYITENQTYKKSEFENDVLPLLLELQGRYSGNQQLENAPCSLTENLPIPYGEDGICHSLESIKLLYIDGNGTSDVTLDNLYIKENLIDIVINRALKYLTEENQTFEYLLDWDCEDVLGIGLCCSYEEALNTNKEEIREEVDSDFDAEIIYKLIELSKGETN
jgi:hypothetical protein